VPGLTVLFTTEASCPKERSDPIIPALATLFRRFLMGCEMAYDFH
jgi:hypothetical protein